MIVQLILWRIFRIVSHESVKLLLAERQVIEFIFEDNARIKAKFFHKLTGIACLADDSGLEVDALNGAPGVNSARYAGYHADDGTNNKVLLDALKKVGVEKSTADYRCALCFIDDGVEILTVGKIDGTIKNSANHFD